METISSLTITKTTTPRPALYFTITFIVSWIIWIPITLAHFGLIPLVIPDGLSNVLRLLGVLAPSTVAICMTAAQGGKPAVRELLGRLKIWRLGWFWWFATAGVMPILLLVVAFVYNLAGIEPRLVFFNQASLASFIVNVVILAIATLGEEIGWRGVALPGLLDEENPRPRFNALQASLILAVTWTLWHVPFWLPQDPFDWYGPIYLVMNLFSIIAMTVYLTWLFRNTRKSLLVPVVWHLSYNIINVAVVEVTGQIVPYILVIALQCLVAAGLVWRFGVGLRKEYN